MVAHAVIPLMLAIVQLTMRNRDYAHTLTLVAWIIPTSRITPFLPPTHAPRTAQVGREEGEGRLRVRMLLRVGMLHDGETRSTAAGGFPCHCNPRKVHTRSLCPHRTDSPIHAPDPNSVRIADGRVSACLYWSYPSSPSGIGGMPVPRHPLHSGSAMRRWGSMVLW